VLHWALLVVSIKEYGCRIRKVKQEALGWQESSKTATPDFRSLIPVGRYDFEGNAGIPGGRSSPPG
jgi:hypothetical protein